MDKQPDPMRRINLSISVLEDIRDGHQLDRRAIVGVIRLLRDELRGDVIPRDGADALSLVSPSPASEALSSRA